MSEPALLSQTNKLIDVEADVQRALKPVAPPPAFRAHLRDGLMMAAQHQQAHRALGFDHAPRRNLAWLWLISAAALGSAIGFIAMLLRAQHARRV